MPLPITEIVFGPAPLAYRASPHDLSLVKPAYDIIQRQDGLIKEYYGLQSEDAATTYGFYIWGSLEKHQAFMDDKAIYNPMLAAVASMFDLPTLTMWHIRTTSEPFAALEAPVTELTTFTLREGQSPADLEALVGKIAQALNEAAKSEAIGIINATCGPILEDEKVVVLIVGWTTLEAHKAAMDADNLKDLGGMFQEAQTIVDIDMVHTSLTLY